MNNDIKRVPITVARENGVSYGGWFPFPIQGDKPTGISLKDNQRLLFCPYCGEWTIFSRNRNEMNTWYCGGVCGWSHTDDFYVRYRNKIFGGKKK